MGSSDRNCRSTMIGSMGDRASATAGSICDRTLNCPTANSARAELGPTWVALRLALVLLVLLVAACGGTRRVLGPPTLSVQEIETVDGRYVARIRLDSPSSMAMTLQHFDWKLTLDGAPAGSGIQALTQVLPPVAGDIVRVDLGAVSTMPILASLSTDRSITYVFEGELQCSEPNVHFPLRYEGRLRATPGKPGSFR